MLIKFVRTVSECVSSLLKTLGMIVIGGSGTVVSGTSTNGAVHKIPGLVSLILQKSFFPVSFATLSLYKGYVLDCSDGLAYFWASPQIPILRNCCKMFVFEGVLVFQLT